MIPLRDENPTRTTPWVNHLLVAVNVAVFAYEVSLMRDAQAAGGRFVEGLAVVPTLLLSPSTWAQTPIPAPLTLLTSMFVHGSFFHLIGNMWYLWIFGDNIEDTLGHARYLLFYLVCGLGAALAQVLVDPRSAVPMVGASGAIAGVLGAYLVLHPQARILTFVFLFFFIRLMYLPAVILLGLWFLIQLMSAFSGGSGGVAWYAHIGGFLAGVLLIGTFVGRRGGGRRRPRPPHLEVIH